MIGLRTSAMVLVLGGISLLAPTQTAAQQEGISIGSATIAAGESGSVDLGSVNIGAPGLAAWSIDVSYDPEVVLVVDCTPQQGSVCNPEYAMDTVRVTGATAGGLEGDATLASITFTCQIEGTTALTISSLVFADASVGDPQPIEAAIQNGSIQCGGAGETPPTPTEVESAEPTPTATKEPADVAVAGTGPGDLGIGWPPLLVAGLVGAGAAWLIAGAAAAGLIASSAIGQRRREAAPEPSSARVASNKGVARTPDWLTAAQARMSSAEGATIPTFRTRREPSP